MALIDFSDSVEMLSSGALFIADAADYRQQAMQCTTGNLISYTRLYVRGYSGTRVLFKFKEELIAIKRKYFCVPSNRQSDVQRGTTVQFTSRQLFAQG